MLTPSLPPVSTVLPPTARCSLNDALVSVLPQIVEGEIGDSGEVPGEVVAVIGTDASQEITGTQVFPSSESESQGGETDAPGDRETGQCVIIFRLGGRLYFFLYDVFVRVSFPLKYFSVGYTEVLML